MELKKVKGNLDLRVIVGFAALIILLSLSFSAASNSTNSTSNETTFDTNSTNETWDDFLDYYGDLMDVDDNESVDNNSLDFMGDAQSLQSSDGQFSTADSGTWVDRTNDSYWECQANCGGWNGSAWEQYGPGMSLATPYYGTWQQGFRPSKVRVTYHNSPPDMTLSVGLYAGGGDFGYCSNYVSGTNCSLNVTSDIRRINLYMSLMSGSYVTKIEFFVEGENETIPSNGTGNFLSVWDTTLLSTGSSSPTQVTLPLEASGTYNFTVYWGDGDSDNITAWNQAEVTHTYSSSDIYQINISGTIEGFRFNNEGDRLKILNITQWGGLNLGNNADYFYGCENLNVPATDNLTLGGTINLHNAFRLTNLSMANFDFWDVTNVTDFSYMFANSSLDSTLDNWSFISYPTLEGMFENATAFNQDLDTWTNTNFINLARMFSGAISFNGDISNWNVGAVTDMNAMFRSAHSFNGNIGAWNTAAVENMASMFFNATNFNQNIITWDTRKITNMSDMFFNATSFDQPLASESSTPDGLVSYYAFDGNASDSIGDNDGVASDSGIWGSSGKIGESADFINGNDYITFTGFESVDTTSSFTYSLWVYVNELPSGLDTSTILQQDSSDADQRAPYLELYDGDLRLRVKRFSYPLITLTWDDIPTHTWLHVVAALDGSTLTLYGNGALQDEETSAHMHNDVTNELVLGYQSESNSQYFDGQIDELSIWNEALSLTEVGDLYNDGSGLRLPPSSWDVSKINDMSSMFENATAFDQDLGSWNVSNVLNFQDFLRGAHLSTPNYDSLLIGWSELTLNSGLIFHGGTSQYCDGQSARDNTLIGTHLWTITDGGLGCSVVNPPHSSCDEPWECEAWGDCVNGIQTRDCDCDCAHDADCEGDHDTSRICQDSCTTDSDCPDDMVCDDGTCTDTCDSSSDCPGDELCVDRICEPQIPCEDNQDCPSGMLCDGFTCHEECTTDSDCPDDMVCDDGTCTDTCDSSSDCPGDELCVDRICEPQIPCEDNQDCPSGMLCDGFTCHEECTTDSDCPDDMICDDGTCTDTCDSSLDCPGDELCVDRICEPQIPCDDNEDCPSGMLCDGSTCHEECTTDSDCPDDMVCDDGTCTDTCDSSLDCPGDELCVDRICEPQIPCEDNQDCPSGMLCDGSTCHEECTTDSDCPDDMVCDDGTCTDTCDSSSDCPGDEECIEGVCTPPADCTTNSDCYDGNACTSDSCIDGACQNSGRTGTSCNDGNPCTENDVCDSGTCTPGDGICECETDSNCNDNNPCTSDTCSNNECEYSLLSGNSCNDGDSCTSGDICGLGVCRPGIGVCDCQTDSDCTTDDPCISSECINNLCQYEATTGNACNDLNPCTQGDICSVGICVPGSGICECQNDGDCNDDDICTTEECVNNICEYDLVTVGNCRDELGILRVGTQRSNPDEKITSQAPEYKIFEKTQKPFGDSGQPGLEIIESKKDEGFVGFITQNAIGFTLLLFAALVLFFFIL